MTRLSMKGTPLGDKYQRLSKDDLAITLRAHQASNDEMKTVQRGYGRRFHVFRELVVGEGHT